MGLQGPRNLSAGGLLLSKLPLFFLKTGVPPYSPEITSFSKLASNNPVSTSASDLHSDIILLPVLHRVLEGCYVTLVRGYPESGSLKPLNI